MIYIYIYVHIWLCDNYTLLALIDTLVVANIIIELVTVINFDARIPFSFSAICASSPEEFCRRATCDTCDVQPAGWGRGIRISGISLFQSWVFPRRVTAIAMLSMLCDWMNDEWWLVMNGWLFRTAICVSVTLQPEGVLKCVIGGHGEIVLRSALQMRRHASITLSTVIFDTHLIHSSTM